MSDPAGALEEGRGAQRARWADAGWRRWGAASSAARLSGTMMDRRRRPERLTGPMLGMAGLSLALAVALAGRLSRPAR